MSAERRLAAVLVPVFRDADGRLRIVQRTDPRGYDYYWFGLGPMVQTPGHQTDLEAIADGYVAVTPLHLDLTHDASVDELRARLSSGAEIPASQV